MVEKLFFHLLNLMLVNAYKLYMKYGTPNLRGKRQHQKFRTDIVKALIESAPNALKPALQNMGRRVGEPLSCLTGQHYPEYIIAKEGAKRSRPLRDCIACKPKRKQTSFICQTCNPPVPLCVGTCFQVYHTHKHYKRVLQGNGDLALSDSDSD